MTAKIKSLQKQLLKWYRKHRRELPWRETKNPYFIWVSEIMLQQTRVDTVIPYYLRFIDRFSTIQELARSSEQEVLQHWQGLGYYRRAKLLHQAAKEVSEKYGGNLPSTQQELSALPGFGPYTSGAVASIAFDQKAPAIDGNVKRVLSRIFGTHESIEEIALQAAQVNSPSEWTQSLMELGALICAHKNPKCLVCSVQNICMAYQTQAVDQYPKITKKPAVKKICAVAWMVKNKIENKILIQQRPESGRWAGMWEFPTFEFSDENVKQNHQFPVTGNLKIGSFVHQLTHRTILVDVMSGIASSKLKLAKGQRWIAPENLSDFPVSRMQLKAWEMYKNKRE